MSGQSVLDQWQVSFKEFVDGTVDRCKQAYTDAADQKYTAEKFLSDSLWYWSSMSDVWFTPASLLRPGLPKVFIVIRQGETDARGGVRIYSSLAYGSVAMDGLPGVNGGGSRVIGNYYLDIKLSNLPNNLARGPYKGQVLDPSNKPIAVIDLRVD